MALLVAAPVLAQISITGVSTAEIPAGRNSLAFDGTVYLETLAGSPVRGRFISASGVALGAPFSIAGGNEGYTGWSTVTAGGSANDPMFLVTYLSTTGSGHTEFGRIVRYGSGTPTVTDRVPLGWIGIDSNGAEKASAAWTGTDWIVGIRLTGLVPQPHVVRFSPNLGVSQPTPIGDGVNYQSWPGVACATTDACLAAGYGDIAPIFGVIYSRLFRKSDFSGIGDVFYLDDHTSRADDPSVTFNKQINAFAATWYQNNYAYLRTIDTIGNMSAHKLYRQDPGWGAGDLTIRYNDASRTSLLTVKGWGAGLYVVELDDTLSPKAAASLVVAWDGKWPSYNPAIAMDPISSRWLVATQQTGGMRGGLVQAGGGTTVPPPPPPPPAGPSISALNPSHVLPPLAGTSVTWTATASGGSGTLLYRFERWREGTGWQEMRAYDASPSAVILAVSGNQAVRVSVKVSGSSADADAQSNAVYFVAGVSRALSLNAAGGGDVFAYHGTDGGGYLLSGNLGTFTELNHGYGWGAGSSVVTADFNGDGLSDILTYNAATGYALRGINNGDTTFTFTEYGWAAGLTVVAGDFNGDGRDDIFTYSKATGNWTKQFTDASWVFQQTSGVWSRNWEVYTGDFNADGITDIFVYNKTPGNADTGRYVRALNAPNGAFSAYVEGSLRWWTGWTVMPGDFDGDSRTDLLLYGTDGRWYKVFFPTNTGPERYVNGQWSLGWTPRVGDFTGDRKDDVFVYNQTTGDWYVVVSTGDGWLYNHAPFVWAGGFVPTVTDINRDGLADLIVYNPADGRWFQIISSAIPAQFGYYTGAAMETGLQMIASLSGR